MKRQVLCLCTGNSCRSQMAEGLVNHWLGNARKAHIGFEDPARATGSDEQRLAVFRRVRDEIRREMFELLMNGNR